MTKFEEKLEKLPIKNIEHPIGDTKYYAAVHVKTLIAQADEEYQELFDKYSNLNDSYEKEVIRSSKLESQIIDLKSQLQQQALPVVPECVGELFNEYRLENIQRLFEFGIDDIKSNKMIKALMWRDKHPDTFSLAFITGKYEVEKPQLFYIDLPKVFGLSDSTSDSTFVSKAESGIISEFTKGKDYALKLTEQEIKSIDERYWQFAVPVEDGE
ncbi:DUF1642 domain-containing protein [Lactococcus cremoris]|uniref:Transcriptional regulator NrdR, nrdR n=2 Tax=Lactococcus lactis subsp. cremoris TaxID=1359 RepID=A0ABR5EDA9_LACLC|nr:DUF1642 domain-containing protein [Lactococcus cremoris]KEY62232.1 putative phage related protein [Lactococcus cremoris subsp. cremoris GE214]KKW70000.1 transcriptional regulator NrdR, nrdR [Lactococcus cremoris]TNU81619.1 DUF1642 domain-containing protein [Lactococcus cremoris]